MGIRDAGSLESALMKAQNIYHHEPDADIFRLAAAYGYGIICNHPFIDGNKRTGYILMRLFLKLNGYEIRADDKEKYDMVIKVASGKMDKEELII